MQRQLQNKSVLGQMYMFRGDQLGTINIMKDSTNIISLMEYKGKIAYASSIGMTELPDDYAEYMRVDSPSIVLFRKRKFGSRHIKKLGLDATLVLDLHSC